MALSNTATPKYYSMFRDAVMNGEVPIYKEIAMTGKFDIKEASGYIAANPNKKK